ncbi:MAG: OmpA family protein [Flavobacteriaceae bacterium]|nr:OmpA family protein [Flavobacteriaceae bacterium]
MNTKSFSVLAFFGFFFVLLSCKNEKNKNPLVPDTIEIPENMEATDDVEDLQKTYEELLKTGAIDAEQFERYMENIQKMKNGSGESDSDFRKNQLNKYTQKIQEKNSQKSEAQLEAEEKTAKLRKLLGTTDNSFIEENITRYSIWGNREKKETLQQIYDATKEEANTIIANYFEISQKELDLLRPLPAKQKIKTETEARTITKQLLPQPIENYLKSGQASSKFKAMMTSRRNDMLIFSGDVIKASEAARKDFYKKNPGWFGEGAATGNTYRDSRDKFIYLPLGDLSFADRLVKHDLGDPAGSNSNGALGIPDMDEKDFPDGDPKICNIGINGQVTLEFTNNAIADVNGPDLYIFEMGAIEPTNLEISKDGKVWINVGQIKGGTAMVDIAEFTKKGETFTYVRLTDLDTPSQLPGADVDAVAAIGGAIRLNLDSSVLFDTGKFQLKESASNELKKLVAAIEEFPKGHIIIEGHTDNVGNPLSNKTLSENRAKEVSNFLKSQLSNSYNFEVKGFGENQPIAPNDTPKNKQKNRRVEILVVPSK